MTFRLTTLFWLFALLAAGMGTFGAVVGLFLVVLVLFLRALWLFGKVTRLEFLVIFCVLFVLVLLLLPAVQIGHTPSLRNMSMSQMKQFVLAMHNYRDTHGAFPPAYSVDEQGSPLHSWRTLLLPYTEELPLYNAIQLDQPWDSPANQRLIAGLELDFTQSLRYGMKVTVPAEMHYLAVVDDQTMWGSGELTDEPGETIAIIEVSGRGIPWYEPRDLSLEDAIDLLTGKSAETHESVHTGFFSDRHVVHDGPYPRLIGMADGRVHSLYASLDRETALALLTASGGEKVDLKHLTDWRQSRPVKEYRTYHWGRVWSLSLFIVLSMVPTRLLLSVHKDSPTPSA